MRPGGLWEVGGKGWRGEGWEVGKEEVEDVVEELFLPMGLGVEDFLEGRLEEVWEKGCCWVFLFR